MTSDPQVIHHFLKRICHPVSQMPGLCLYSNDVIGSGWQARCANRYDRSQFSLYLNISADRALEMASWHSVLHAAGARPRNLPPERRVIAVLPPMTRYVKNFPAGR